MSRRSVWGWLIGLTAAGLCALPLMALGFPAVLRIPKAKVHPPGAPEAAALFSHRAHGQFTCYACHPSVFPQARLAFTHEEMNRGERCGRCHDGSRATAINLMPCASCHEPR